MDASNSSTATRHHRPYFTPRDLDYLIDKKSLRGAQEDKTRHQACSFLEALGGRVGFPRKTIATAQSLYHRFHLFFPRKEFHFYDVALASAYVSTKMHDTLKKPQELLSVSYALRYPEMVPKSRGPVGDVDLDTTVESDRQRILVIERLILETICFNFTSKMAFPYVIKIGRAVGADKKLTKLAWRVAVDTHRTLVPLQYTPVTIALSSLYTAACLVTLSPNHPTDVLENATKVRTLLGQHGDWERKFQAHVEDLDLIAHTVLDLLITATQLPSTNTSPSTPSSPHSNHHSSPRGGIAEALPYNADQLTQLKIALRELEHESRERTNHLETLDDITGIGKNESSVRYLFAPPGLAQPV
ncbi:cyclin-like protein [Cylindrobasidium torrendii FP15055 ss-10]|uniref:Cyclin-like protein n=1 Tax=Cylindrobasidium torrendii FP15055 ss-10 TaxID=1314674 RepID=A0A0D7BIW5_9AGAR|nr:cyclin-like protein [Cylindrobasidium torrendii FP15055 ss-10]